MLAFHRLLHVPSAFVGSHFPLPVELPCQARQPRQAHASLISLHWLTHVVFLCLLNFLVRHVSLYRLMHLWSAFTGSHMGFPFLRLLPWQAHSLQLFHRNLSYTTNHMKEFESIHKKFVDIYIYIFKSNQDFWFKFLTQILKYNVRFRFLNRKSLNGNLDSDIWIQNAQV